MTKRDESVANRIILTKQKMLSALAKNVGDIAKACKEADIVRKTHWNYLNSDPEYKEAVENMLETVLDHLEGELDFGIDGQYTLRVKADGSPDLDANGRQIRDYINPPDRTLLKFKLLTKGKDRGYVYRNEVTGPDANPLFGGFEINIKRKK